MIIDPRLYSPIPDMASLQKKGESWYCQFLYQGRRHTLTLGKVDNDEAKATAARVDYILMRIRQRLLQVPAGMNIVTFIEHDGNPPAAAQSTPDSIPFCEFREAYLKTFGNGALEANTLYTAGIHLRHIGKTLGQKFPMDTLGLPQLQRHVERRQQKVSPTTIKKLVNPNRRKVQFRLRQDTAQPTSGELLTA